jgi:hypothetical protein
MMDFTSAIDSTSAYSGYGALEVDDSSTSPMSAWPGEFETPPVGNDETLPVAFQTPNSNYCLGDQDDSEISALQQQLAAQQNEIDQLQREYRNLGGGGTEPQPPRCGGPPRGRIMQPFEASTPRPETLTAQRSELQTGQRPEL